MAQQSDESGTSPQQQRNIQQSRITTDASDVPLQQQQGDVPGKPELPKDQMSLDSVVGGSDGLQKELETARSSYMDDLNKKAKAAGWDFGDNEQKIDNIQAAASTLNRNTTTTSSVPALSRASSVPASSAPPAPSGRTGNNNNNNNNTFDIQRQMEEKKEQKDMDIGYVTTNTSDTRTRDGGWGRTLQQHEINGECESWETIQNRENWWSNLLDRNNAWYIYLCLYIIYPFRFCSFYIFCVLYI